MTDASLCFGVGCPQREQCWRFMASPDPRGQSWFEPPNVGNRCEYFIGYFKAAGVVLPKARP